MKQRMSMFRYSRVHKQARHKSITTRTRAMPIRTTVNPVCTKCGTIKNSDKHSCCAWGGAWFNKCRNPGDSNFVQTWTEGIQSCKYFVSWLSRKVQSLQSQIMLRHESTITVQALRFQQKVVGSAFDTVLRYDSRNWTSHVPRICTGDISLYNYLFT